MTGSRPRVAPGAMPESRTRLWVPRRVLITRSAAERPHIAEIIARCADAGVEDIRFLPADRLTGLTGADERATYALAKSTLAVVVSPPSGAEALPDPAERGLAHRSRPRLPRALPVLL